MYQASPEVSQFVSEVCDRFRKEGNGNIVVSMSLAISTCAQTFLAAGGNIQAADAVGEAVKLGFITTLKAYKDMSKQNHPGNRRLT